MRLVKSVVLLKVGYQVYVSGERYAPTTSTLFIHWIEDWVRPTFGLEFSEKKISLYGKIFGDVLTKGWIAHGSEFVRGRRQCWFQWWDSGTIHVYRT